MLFIVFSVSVGNPIINIAETIILLSSSSRIFVNCTSLDTVNLSALLNTSAFELSTPTFVPFNPHFKSSFIKFVSSILR